jgi:DNA-binding response OmpR family regulator
MLVDDNPEFLKGLEFTLEMEGFRVWKASNGQHALDELKTVFQDNAGSGSVKERLPDLILVDIMMPVMDGYALYERLRSNPYTNHIPVIFLTAKDSELDIRYGKELGSEDYLTKLASTEDILASIKGKLTRIQQRRALAAQYNQEEESFNDRLFKGNMAIMIIVFVFLLIVFLSGLAVMSGFWG